MMDFGLLQKEKAIQNFHFPSGLYLGHVKKTKISIIFPRAEMLAKDIAAKMNRHHRSIYERMRHRSGTLVEKGNSRPTEPTTSDSERAGNGLSERDILLKPIITVPVVSGNALEAINSFLGRSPW